MSAKRRIAFITGTRAEYGLLYWTMRELEERGADVQLIVTGAHLSADHGMTVKQIEADGWNIAARVDMQLTSDEPLAIARSMGRALSGIAEAVASIKPDMVVILGDRYEMAAAAEAVAVMQVPIAHIHGGEETEGALDNAWRHAITKLSYWHLPPYEKARQRIIQMGEVPQHVFNVGAPGIDNLVRLDLLNHAQLEDEFKITLSSPVILFTYHPEELSHISVEGQIATMMNALNAFPQATLLLTGANADKGGRIINDELQRFAKSRSQAVFRMSFGSRLYLSAMRIADVVVGNSSSAMIETASLGRATVNIGDRQAGRLKAPTVISCACDEKQIVASIRQALSPEFQRTLAPSTLYGTPGEVAEKIAQTLLSVSIPQTLRKPFYDANL